MGAFFAAERWRTGLEWRVGGGLERETEATYKIHYVN